MLQIDVNTEKKHRQWRVSSYIYRIINSIFPASLVVENFQPLSDLSLMSRKDNELNFSVVNFSLATAKIYAIEKRASSVNLDIVLPNLVPRVFESYLVIRKHPMAFTTKEIIIPNSKHCKNDRNLNLKETVLAGWQFNYFISSPEIWQKRNLSFKAKLFLL